MDVYGDVSDFNTNPSFDTAPLTKTPVVTPYNGAAIPATPKLSWSQVDGAVGYNVYLNDVSTGKQVLYDQNVASNSYGVARPLTLGDRLNSVS